MAGKGFAPSGKRSRESDQRRDEAAITKVEPDSELRGPELPDDLNDASGEQIRWPSLTRRWWGTWRKSPQAKTFTETDWDFLLETALIHRAFVLGDHRVAAELRLRVAKFGATPEDRMRLRLSIVEPPQPALQPAQPSADGDELAAARRRRISEEAAGA